MSDNIKNTLIREIQCELTNALTTENIKVVINTLTVHLSNYELSKKCTDIAIIETESEQIVKMFLATKKIEGKSDKTIDAYRRRLDELMRVVNKPLKDMTVFDMRMYLAYKQMNGCTERTASSYRSILVAFFNWAYGEKLIPDNPVLTLGVIKYNREIKKPFSNVELEQLRLTCKNVRDITIMEVFLATGCRVGELVKIKISDIDFANMEIKVIGKGNKQRIVYFDAVTAMWIKKYLATRSDQCPALFVGKRAKNTNAFKPIKEGTVRFMLKGLEQSSGVENVHPHRFRRTLATTLIKREMSVQEVAAILGHSNINTTMTYVYMDNLSIRAAYNKRAA